jgi:chromosomal replication initiator protein
MQLHQANPELIRQYQERKARIARMEGRAFHKQAVAPVEVISNVIELHAEPTEAQKMAAWTARQVAMQGWFKAAHDDGEDGLRPKLRVIKKVVAAKFNVRILDMESKRRTADVVFPRQLAAYLCKTMTLKSLPEIGREFGNRDHTTILHAARKFTALEANNPEIATMIRELKSEIERRTNNE